MELHEKLGLEKPEDKPINWLWPDGGHKVRRGLAILVHGLLFIISKKKK